LYWPVIDILTLKNAPKTLLFTLIVKFLAKTRFETNTHAFVTSPEIVAAIAISGRLDFDPTKIH
jgi:aconitate hydratase